jgi:hypothetical protein
VVVATVPEYIVCFLFGMTIQAENLEKAQEIVNTSPRVRDGILADSARVVEWQVHLGRDRFTDEINHAAS